MRIDAQIFEIRAASSTQWPPTPAISGEFSEPAQPRLLAGSAKGKELMQAFVEPRALTVPGTSGPVPRHADACSSWLGTAPGEYDLQT